VFTFEFFTGLGERELEYAFNPNKHLLVIRKPAVPITEEWTIHFH
jgi:hypothetical protein